MREIALDAIRDLLEENNRQPVSLDSIYQRCSVKRIPDDAVTACITEYEKLGTFVIDEEQKVLWAIY